MGLCRRRMRKIGILGTIILEFEELYPTFLHELRFEYPIVSMFRSIDVLFKNFQGLKIRG